MKLNKLLNNRINANIVNSMITEYDIKAAHTTALYYIKGPEIYEKLMSMPKLERNIHIGKMIKEDKNLRKQIDEMIISWFNEFLEENKIIEINFLATTPDSILIKNQLAVKTKFGEAKNVLIRNKENISYSSLFVVDKLHFILYDNMSKRLRIKGLGVEEVANKYPFVNGPMRDLCGILDGYMTTNRIEFLKRLKMFRRTYLNSSNIEVFRSVNDKNMFKYIVDDSIELVDIPIKESENVKLVKTDNYMNYILPLIQSFI